MNAHQQTMVELAQEYLKFRRSLGFKLKIEGQQLLKFAEHVDQSEHSGPLTTELALHWACLPEGASSLYHARRLEVVRCFAKFRAIFDERTEVPPQKLIGPAHRRTAPHLYSDREISDLLQAAGELSPAAGLRPQTYQTLLGLLASSGLRISEALKLRRVDIDQEQRVLMIVETKFQKSRLVPLHSSVAERLQAYVAFRDKCVAAPESDAYFLSGRGAALKYSTVRSTFRTLCRRLGWKATGGRRRPRLYDLRHTFACRRLLQWYREGVDVDHAIASLTAYLGHGKVTDTYWYLTGTPELFRIAARRFEELADAAQKEVHP